MAWSLGGEGAPPLAPEVRGIMATIPSGEALHLSLVTQVCNDFHRMGGPTALDCGGCRHQGACRRQVEDALLFAGMISRQPPAT